MIERLHLYGSIYGHEVRDPQDDSLVLGWKIYLESNEDGEGDQDGVQVPVKSRYAADKVGEAMQHALDEGKREGYRRGVGDTEARVKYVAELVLSPIAKAIDTLNKDHQHS